MNTFDTDDTDPSQIRNTLLITRHDELQPFIDWLSEARPGTAIWSVQGIGGIGKTTFLGQIQASARRYGADTVYIDGAIGFTNASDLLSYLHSSLQFSSSSSTPLFGSLLNQWHERTHSKKTVILFDHVEEMSFLESFLRKEFVPQVPFENVLLVFASRQGLSIGWRTDPNCVVRLKSLDLHPFTWEQSMQYTFEFGIHDLQLQQKISRATAGYPLALAFAVQTTEQQETAKFGGDWEAVLEMAFRMFSEVAPHLSPLVEGLAFLRSATQEMLVELLELEVPRDHFRDLSRLSFVRTTEMGLVMHDVARTFLLNDLKLRNPQQFDNLFLRAVMVLEKAIQHYPKRLTYQVCHNMATLCTFRPSALTFPHPTMQMILSARALPNCEFLIESDVALLHDMLDKGMASGLFLEETMDHHGLLDVLIHLSPEGFRIVRDRHGHPLAFAAFVPLCGECLAQLPPHIVDMVRRGLGEDFSTYEMTHMAQTDTVLNLMSCVANETEEHTFFDLLLALKVYGWAELSQGRRCLLFGSRPEVTSFYTQLHYEPLYTDTVAPTPGSIMFALDFRQKSMGRWLASLLLNTEIAEAHSTVTPTVESLREALKCLRRPKQYEHIELASALGMSADALMARLSELLLEKRPTTPLTVELQRVLALTYLGQRQGVFAISRDMNISRSTYYRYLEQAHTALLQVLTR
ncbi:hypothetical protein C7445_10389 [Alicyclobacillus sacchari]|uniref:NB-ARC domain-containing protein n=1 Tax=Alicyclobacillus sacchari TaxID=392010 RepID=A0A4R8LTD7_9BACL|nr:hypothetical protein [Alicyclobacillus sacchari]TDY50045.1 hypothetical protein C7445_10389 [Alicyclobacillus sacchari]GMA57618.1 hypothetical protein GCM10025858_21210 [Alicyclobacillus sacchari]